MKKIDVLLLVDDDYIANFLTKELASEMGVAREIIVANDGQEALEKLHNYDEQHINNNTSLLILLDLNMPVMDGFEFLEEYSKLTINSPCKIVVLTSSNNSKDIERARSYNVFDYIHKPLTEEKLKDLLFQLNES